MQALQSVGGVKTGIYSYVDPFDPRTGILLCPDLDLHVNLFESAFYIEVITFLFVLILKNDVAIFHNFYSSTLDKDENFTPTAIRCHNQQASLKLDGNDSLREVLFWHYKHTVILSWGGACITQYLRTVYIASDETFAWSTDLEDEFSHSSPSSPASLSD